MPLDSSATAVTAGRHSIDLRAGLRETGQRQVGGIAAAVRDSRPVEIERVASSAAVFCPAAAV